VFSSPGAIGAARTFPTALVRRRTPSLVGRAAITIPLTFSRASGWDAQHYVSESGTRLLRPEAALASRAALLLGHLTTFFARRNRCRALAKRGNVHKGNVHKWAGAPKERSYARWGLSPRSLLAWAPTEPLIGRVHRGQRRFPRRHRISPS